MAGEQPKGICFDCSKSEAYTPQSGLKQWRRKLQGVVKIFINKDPITLERLREAACYVFVAPQERFSAEEFESMRQYMEEGGALMFMLAEGGESRLGTNLNIFLEEYGIAVNADSVVRTVYYKYLHPKEVYISHGVLNRGINAGAGKKLGGAREAGAAALSSSISEAGPNAQLAFAYPYGASLTVQKPAFPVLSSGHISFPLNRPICALHESPGGGRLCVLGSSHIFEDGWFDKDENGKLADVLVKWLLSLEGVSMDPLDSDDVEIAEYHHVPDTESLAQRVRCCLEETEDVTRDFTTLFDDSLFKFDTSLIPEAVQLYKVRAAQQACACGAALRAAWWACESSWLCSLPMGCLACCLASVPYGLSPLLAPPPSSSCCAPSRPSHRLSLLAAIRGEARASLAHPPGVRDTPAALAARGMRTRDAQRPLPQACSREHTRACAMPHAPGQCRLRTSAGFSVLFAVADWPDAA
jgi:intraflagellar transport protein 52